MFTGRIFECPPSVMLNSLEALHQLPDDTLVWPGKELT